MTDTRLISRRSRRLAWLLVAVTGPPALTLVWLGWQLLQHDRSLLAQRAVERQHAALSVVTRALDAALSHAERHLATGPVPDGTTRLTVSASGVRAEPADAMLWLPTRPAWPGVESRQFADAEQIEFRNRPEALATYRTAARSPDDAVRAGALLRVARVMRRQRQWDHALEAYTSLSSIVDREIEGAPADLQARRASVSVLEDAGRADQMRAHAAALEADLLAGRWRLDRPAWTLTVADLTRWLGRPVPVPPQRAQLSAVADWLWERRLRDAGQGRRLAIDVDATMMTVLIEPRGAEIVALVAPPAIVRAWAGAALGRAPGRPSLSLVGAGRSIVAGDGRGTDTGMLKASPEDTGLPWTVALGAGEDPALAMEFATRRRLLAVGLGAILLLLGGGSYFLWRVVEREMAVARLQTDFVAAVSHELRTPLTSLRHMTELLQEDDELPRAQRATFYRALGRNTDRLHRLVESLLDFARMESGRQPYHPQPLDAGAFASAVVADFRQQAAATGVAIDLDLDGPAACVHADRASLGSALWNLLDNAVKYSPSGGAVRVTVGPHPAGVAIAVCDRGLGVPPGERAEIFKRFVRGAQAQHLGIKGTGLGLAMASHIVEAHGGRIELDSEEGVGSTFRLVLPAMS